MKSKLTMLTLAGALALIAAAPNAMASNQKGSSARAPRTTSASKVTVAKAATRMSSKTSAIPPHTILKGAKDNPF